MFFSNSSDSGLLGSVWCWGRGLTENWRLTWGAGFAVVPTEGKEKAFRQAVQKERNGESKGLQARAALKTCAPEALLKTQTNLGSKGNEPLALTFCVCPIENKRRPRAVHHYLFVQSQCGSSKGDILRPTSQNEPAHRFSVGQTVQPASAVPGTCPSRFASSFRGCQDGGSRRTL